VVNSLNSPRDGIIGFIELLGLTLSANGCMITPALVTLTHMRAGVTSSVANSTDHIIKSPPLMSRDAPVM
jgi:hypothetical protein